MKRTVSSVGEEDCLSFLRAVADAFMRGDIATATSFHAHPVVTFANRMPRLEASRAETFRILSDRWNRLRAAGAHSVTVTIREFTAQHVRRARVVSEWRYLNQTGETVGISELVHFCARGADGALIIEMLELRRLAASDADPPSRPI